MFSLKRWIIISALLGLVVGVLSNGQWVTALIASLTLGIVIVLVDRWTTPDVDSDFGLLTDEVEQPSTEDAPEPPPTPKTASLR